MKPLTAFLSGLILASCGSSTGTEPATLTSSLMGDIIDLTHPFDGQTVYWPTARRFSLEVDSKGFTETGYYYEANTFCAAEHGGTHLDAPIHFAQNRWSTEQIPLERLIRPGVVVDVTQAVASDRDYQIMVADVEAWENTNGHLPDGVIVLFRTGFGGYWPDAGRYLGTARRGQEAVAELHFPGLSQELARWLAQERDVSAIGIDTASIDYGQSREFESHRILFEANIPAFENVAGLHHLPSSGFTVVALPMKIRGGSGGPLRIVAIQ